MSAAISTPTNPPDLRTFKLVNVNLNALGDQGTFTGLPERPFVVSGFRLWNYTAVPGSLTSVSLRDGTTGTGNQLLGPLVGMNTVVTSTAASLDILASQNIISFNRILNSGSLPNFQLYLNVAVANISALTCNANLTITVL